MTEDEGRLVSIEELINEGPSLLEPIDWHDLLTGVPPAMRWLCEPLLPEGRHIALFGPPKVGKSLFGLELAACLASGREMLGRTTPPTRVLYLDDENHRHFDIRPRIEDMRFEATELENLVYVDFPNIAPLDTPRGGEMLLAEVEEHECKLVILDTLARFVEGAENSNDTWNDFYRHTGMPLKKRGVAMVRLDHSGKDQAKGQRGGSAKSGDVDAVWQMSIPKGATGVVQLFCASSRMPVPAREITLAIETTPHLHHKVIGGGVPLTPAEKAAKKDSELAELLDAEGIPDGLSVRKTRDALATRGIRKSKDSVGRAIKIRNEDHGHLPVSSPIDDIEGEAAAEWVDGFGEPDWDNQPPGSDWDDANFQPGDDKSVPGTDQGHSFRWLSLDDLGTHRGRCTRRYETAGR